MAAVKRKLKKRKDNRGPAAAQENREALLETARRVFAERGFHVPLSAIATEAGVGQAVLYRHFPTRIALAQAVFEQNLRAYDPVVEHPGPRTLHRLWGLLCDDLIDSAAFVELAVEARRTSPSTHEGDQLRVFVEKALPAALAAGTVPKDFTVEEFLVGVRMAYGIVVTSIGEDNAALRKTLRSALPRLAAAIHDLRVTQ